MRNKNILVIVLFFSLVLFSCGIIRIDFSHAINHFLDFSDTIDYAEKYTDCYGKAYTGHCQMNIDPVCGCDGVTYGNACEARRAGVKKYIKGKCR